MGGEGPPNRPTGQMTDMDLLILFGIVLAITCGSLALIGGFAALLFHAFP